VAPNGNFARECARRNLPQPSSKSLFERCEQLRSHQRSKTARASPWIGDPQVVADPSRELHGCNIVLAGSRNGCLVKHPFDCPLPAVRQCHREYRENREYGAHGEVLGKGGAQMVIEGVDPAHI
jgi:hypothetical protein